VTNRKEEMPDNKTQMIALRLSPSQLAYVTAYAKQNQVTVSEVIRLSIQYMIPEAKA
jgi:hypothetical protein